MALISLAVVIVGWRIEPDRNSNWLMVLFAAFLTSSPCLYGLEYSEDFETVFVWGHVNGFHAGVAAVRSVWVQSLQLTGTMG